MSEHMNEKLSQLMDGEPEGGDGGIIDELIHDRSARDAWWRYHIISDILRHGAITLAHRDLTTRISARIENEPAILAPKSFAPRNWLRPVAGFAIAASVAVIAILGIQKRGEDISGPPAHMTQAVSRNAPVVPVTGQFNVPARLASVETLEEIVVPEPVNSRMNSYLLNYNEYRTTETSMQGMLPYVRIIAHENDD